MLPPEEKLKHYNCRAQAYEDDQEVTTWNIYIK